MYTTMNDDRGESENDTSVTDTISRFAKTAFTAQGLEAAGRFTKEKAMDLKTRAQEGDRSLRFLAFIGGIACILVGSYELVSRFFRLDLVAAIIDLYIILLGIVVVVLEGKDVFLSERLGQNINKYAMFLKFLWGRGSLYFICGTLQLSQFDLFNLISGSYMCAIGILYIVVGHNTANKLRTVRRSLYPEFALRAKFEAANVDGDGLTVKQFRVLCEDLGLDFTARETEAAFGHIRKRGNDNSNDNLLSYEAFSVWWDDPEGEGRIDDNAFMFV